MSGDWLFFYCDVVDFFFLCMFDISGDEYLCNDGYFSVGVYVSFLFYYVFYDVY